MSFILDALKKLEREKETRGAGVVMVGPVQWGGPDRQRQRRRLVLATAGLVLLAAGALWWVATRPDPTGVAPPPPAAATTAVAPVEPPPAPAGTATPAAPIAAPPPRGLDLPASRPAIVPEPETSAAGPAEPRVETAGEDEGGTLLLEEGAPATSGPDELPTEAPPAAPAPEYRLTAISERDGRPVALLNDRLVHEGDSFDGLRIIRIGPADIEIEVDGERKTIGF